MKASVLTLQRPARTAVFTLHVALVMLHHPGLVTAGSITRTDSWPGYVRHLPQQVYAADSNAYLSSFEGIQIFNLGDAAHPAALSFLPLFAYWESPMDIHYLASSNRLAVGVGVSFGTYTNRVMGIDVSNPQEPQLVWSGALLHRPNQVYQADQKVYSSHNLNGLTLSVWGASGYGSKPPSITNATGRVAVSGSRLYVPSSTGFRIFNAADEAYLGAYLAGSEGHALAVDSFLVLLAAEDGLHVVDVTAADAPVQVGYLPLSAEAYNPTAIQLSDAHACLIFSETNLFMTVDIGTPGSPAVSGTYTFSGPVRNMSVDNGRAYLLAADQRYGSSDLHLLDISDPAIIVSLGRLYAHGSAVHLAAGTNVLILADSQNGLCLLGTESPALSVIGHLPGEVRTFAVDNNRVYAGRSDGLEIYDISLPESPVSVTNHYEPATHIAVGDDYLYRIGGWGMPELVISDKTDNLNELHRLSWIEGINQIRSFDMVNDLYALMVDDFAGNMVIINVQDPALPVLTNYYATAPIMDVAKRIDMGGTNALLATTNGIEVLDLSGEPPFQVVGSWDCPEGRTPRSLCVDGDRVAVSSIDHVWILDSTQFSGGDPLVADTSIGHAVSHMLLSGNRLYVAAGAEGIIVYEIDTETGGPMLHVTRSTSNRIELEWDAAGFGWQVQHIEDLTSSNGWLTLPGTDAMTATNLDTALPRQFFRLMK